MIELCNAALRVQVLDPVEDAARLGVRFGSGGYVWQVEDHRAGPLLSGPEGDVEHPDPFNGHGLPEAFRDRSREGQLFTWHAGLGLTPGVGIVERLPGGPVVLVEPCVWEITRAADHLIFRTEHGHGPFRYALVRVIQLVERDLLSVTRFRNLGRAPLQLQWFAHPFFALDDRGLITAELPEGYALPTPSGFTLLGRYLSPSQRFRGKDEGAFELLQLPPERPLAVRLSHPRLQYVDFSTTFTPSECPIWMNGHTFSIEPYQSLALEPAETRQWTLRTSFGPAHLSPGG